MLWCPSLKRSKEDTHVKYSVVQHAVLSTGRVQKVYHKGWWGTSYGRRMSVSEGCTHNWVDPEGLEEASIHRGEGSTGLAMGAGAQERRGKYHGESN